MKALIQRVFEGRVTVAGDVVGEIGGGIVLLLGIDKGDDDAAVSRLVERVLGYRIFADEAGHMNLSLTDVAGELLVVSQFTLAANTRKGTRPSFSSAARPQQAEVLYERFVDLARMQLGTVATGQFGADMRVDIAGDGPVTFLLGV